MQIPLRYLLLPTLLLLATVLRLGAQNFPMNGMPVNACGGYFLDSGGNVDGYGENENFTTTICSSGMGGPGNTHIQLFFSGIDIGPGETIAFYDAATANPAAQFDNGVLVNPDDPFIIQATAANISGCITVVFTSDGTDEGNDGWIANIQCVRSCQTVEAVITSSVPATMPVDTGWIDICPGETITLEGMGTFPQNGLSYAQSNATSTFEWTFGDGDVGIGTSTSHTYLEPGGYYVTLTVTDALGCKNTNFMTRRVRVAAPPDFGAMGILDTTICGGDTIRLTSSVDALNPANINAANNTLAFLPTTSRADTLLLPDGLGGQYEANLLFTQFSPGATLDNATDLEGISIDFEHSYGGDLDMELICPDGRSIFLLDFPSTLMSADFGEPFASAPSDGQSLDLTPGDGYIYTFTDNAPNGTLINFVRPIRTFTTVPSSGTGMEFTYTDTYFPAGEYQPQQSFGDLVGCPLNGVWTLRITDNLASDNGWLFGMSIAFNPALYGNIETFTPNFTDWGWETNPTVFDATPGSLAAAPPNPGTAAYTFWTLDDFGCRHDTTLTFNVLPPTHPDCYTCDIQANPPADAFLFCPGETATLDASATGPLRQAIPFERFPQAMIGFANHPASNPLRSTLAVSSIQPVTLTNPLAQIQSVCIELPTDNTSHLTIRLQAPNGTVLTLAAGTVGNAGFVGTCFTPTALETLTTGTSPYTGNFQPQGNWNTLIGTPINGDWTLLVSDNSGPLNFGELLQWSITINAENAYSYVWSPAAGLENPTSPTPVASPSTGTDYEVTITDLYGCTYTDTVRVDLAAELPSPNVTCSEVGSTLTFNWDALPGFTQFEYDLVRPDGSTTGWMGPVTDRFLTIDNLANGDQVSLTVRVFVPDNINDCPIPLSNTTCISTFCGLDMAPPTTTGVSCFGVADGQVIINITAGEAPFAISINGVTYMVTTIPNLPAGDYDLVVTDAVGCSITTTFNIPTPNGLSANAIQTFASCAGEGNNTAQVTANGGTGALTYMWSNGATTPSVTALAAGNYGVTVTDSNGCGIATALVISDLAPITFNFIAEPPTCTGDNDGGVGVKPNHGRRRHPTR